MPKIIIAGCGFVGVATARLFERQGWKVTGATHSAQSASLLAEEPYEVVACDITSRDALAVCPGLHGAQVVIHCASSGRGGVDQYRSVYLEGARNLLEVSNPDTLVFTSSTSVYAQTSGEWVTEESPAEPDRETGRILRETERLVVGAGGMVARLGGIYGPGRSVLLKKFLCGEAVIEGDGTRWINQVHQEDIATALWCMVEAKTGGLYNVGDDRPLQQRAIYEWLAGHFHQPVPPSGPIDLNRKRGWTNKRVSNTKLRGLGWGPRYPSFLEAVSCGLKPE